MKKLFSILVAALTLFSADAQNLVPNPWFEKYINCPPDLSIMGMPLPVNDWFLPTKATADYYNICNNSLNGRVGVPGNLLGNQFAASGVGYMGIVVYHQSNAWEYKEYIACKLNSPMIPGIQYSVSMKVSLAEGYSKAGSNGLAVYFSTDSLPSHYDTTVNTLPFTPQVDYSNYGVITDTLNWTALKDTFLADSAYEYITIGVFLPNANMTLQPVGSGGMYGTYYFIDNVMIAELGREPSEPGPTGIEDVSLSSLTISPNPVADKAVFQLNGQPGLPYSVSLINMIGQTVWQRSGVTGKEIIFERKGLPAGVYGYQLSTGGVIVQRGKVVLE